MADQLNLVSADPPALDGQALDALYAIATPDEVTSFLTTLRQIRAGQAVDLWKAQLVIEIITRLADDISRNTQKHPGRP